MSTLAVQVPVLELLGSELVPQAISPGKTHKTTERARSVNGFDGVNLFIKASPFVIRAAHHARLRAHAALGYRLIDNRVRMSANYDLAVSLCLWGGAQMKPRGPGAPF